MGVRPRAFALSPFAFFCPVYLFLGRKRFRFFLIEKHKLHDKEIEIETCLPSNWEGKKKSISIEISFLVPKNDCA